LGARGGGAARRRRRPRGSARLGITGPGQTWPSGHEIERGWALETARGMGKAPRASARTYDGRSRACERLGGAAAAALAGVRELGWLGCTTAKTTRVAEWGGGVGAHRGSRRPDCAAQRNGGEVVRRSRAALAEVGAAGLLRASGWHGSMRGVTVKQAEGSAGSGAPRRRGIERRPTHLRRRSGEVPGAVEVRCRRWRPRGGLWCTGEASAAARAGCGAAEQH